MTMIAWLVLGLIAGFAAHKIVDHTGLGVILGIVLSIALGVVGAFGVIVLFSVVCRAPVTGFNIQNMTSAIVSSVVVLAIFHHKRKRAP